MKLATLNARHDAGRERVFTLEERLAAVYAKAFRRAGRLAARRFRKLAAAHLVAATPNWVPPEPEELVEPVAFDAQAEARARRIHKLALKLAVATPAEISAHPESEFDLTSPLAQAVLDQTALKATNLSREIHDVIVRVIADAYVKGLSVDATAVELQAGISKLSKTTALMQARTDLNGLANAASIAQAKTLGDSAPRYKSWLTAGDERVRDAHMDADGQTVPIDQPFMVDSEPLNFPGDPLGSNENVINCRCAVTYADSVQPSARDIRSGVESSEPEEDPRMRLVDAITAATDPATTDAATEAEAQDAPDEVVEVEPVRWRAVLAVEGEETADGRILDPGSLEWRDLPLTLMAMVENSEMGHAGAVVAGRIDSISRQGNDIVGEGIFDPGEYGMEIARLVGDQTLRGVSVDIATEEWEERPANVPAEVVDEGGEILIEGGPVSSEDLPEYIFAVTKGLILGATVCPFPAIASASIEIVTASAFRAAAEMPPLVLRLTRELALVADADVEAEQPHDGSAVLLYPEPDQAAALAIDGGEPPDTLHCTLAMCPGVTFDDLCQAVGEFAPTWQEIDGIVSGAGSFAVGDDGSPSVLLPSVVGLAALRTQLVDALGDSGIEIATDHDFMPHITLDYTPEPNMPDHEGRVGQQVTFRKMSVTGPNDERQDFPLGQADEADVVTAAAAGLAPVAPPADWFTDPDLDELTPLTVTPEGRVFGHVAGWDSCHIGYSGRCVSPPRSPSGYAFFHLGELETVEGERVSVGQVTLDTGHAPLSANRATAAAHYDNTGAAVADVVVGADKHGTWMSGALRPDVSAERVRELAAAKISGDWRGKELVGLLAVNVPGFPIPRPAARLLASGDEPMALVAAGIVGAPDPARTLARIDAMSARILGRDAMLATIEGRDEALTAAAFKLTLEMDGGEGASPVIEFVNAGAQTLDREIGLQVDYFRDHGYWSPDQLAGADLDESSWEAVQAAAPLLVAKPDLPFSVETRERLLREGFLLV